MNFQKTEHNPIDDTNESKQLKQKGYTDGCKNAAAKLKTVNSLRIIIDDDEIDTILKLGTFHGENVFLFKRLNGQTAVIPMKIANIKYPDAVMDFYERHASIPPTVN